jgi:hypothetical protein
MKRRTTTLVIAAVVSLMFLAGLYRLFELRFASGDIYPPSSSRRADPIGTRALYQSLTLQPGLTVRQNLERLPRLTDGPGTTLLLLGVAPNDIQHPGSSFEENAALLAFVQRGGRLVLGVEHESLQLTTNAIRKALRGFAVMPPTATNAPRHLGADLGYLLVYGQEITNTVAQRLVPDASLPSDIPWTSAWSLTNLSTGWRAVYARDEKVVIAERSWGDGSVVFLASDYLLSNEALRSAPQTALISWIIGPAHKAIFDETHLGLSLEPGVAGLVLKYRLGGAAFGLLMLAGLHVWRSMARFNPPPESVSPDSVVHGRGSAAGLLNILRRSVSPAEITAVCMDEWRATHTRRALATDRRVADAQDCLNLEMDRPPRDRNPVDTYRRLAKILRSR